MEPWDRPKPSRSHDRFRSRRDNPSFSSTLLDQIYRSIDDDGDSMRKNKQLHDDKILPHRRSVAADFDRSAAPRSTDSVFFKHSSSSSSDSSGFSSSESDSFYGRSRSSPAKPIRTAVERLDRSPVQIHRSGVQKQELGSFLRTKSKALKMYSELKKAKQPISPGGRLASFLNSLFTAGNAKKLKKVSTAGNAALSSSTCSSASSFSRSCLSKTPSSSTGKSKRSVRFCPVSVILDEDSRPCGHKRLHEKETNPNQSRSFNLDELEIHAMEENRRVIEAAKDLLRSYQMKKKKNDRSSTEDTRNVGVIAMDEDEDDAASCASSDLFELDNLSEIGIERYREELPVYETTHLSTNRAIASGLIV
ncbi:PREDICTED: protein BIG GRAIN 1-like B [Tarenaya hassleriana]|uniref:protein BIG GRAIN 1-like B n=1 Tax=Tarenaya hassleriana TaxID=28532 RepID=UPI00053C6290|nr:PREDICTED: protein BIG GRAIN 1-like B [Tarenaya hassleriana]